MLANFFNYGEMLKRRATVRMPPHWTSFRSISNTLVVRAAILIPLIGYFLILNDWIVSKAGDIYPGSNEPWRLLTTYFGLCFVAAGSLFYQGFCPPVVKRHEDATAYVISYAPSMSDTEEERVRQAVVRGDSESSARVTGISERYDRLFQLEGRDSGGRPVFERQEQLKVESRREILQAHFDMCNSQWYPFRIVAGACYLIGLAILAIPSVSVFYRVAQILLRLLWPT